MADDSETPLTTPGAASETGPPGDPFPRERVAVLIRRLPVYLRLSIGLAADSRLPKWRRAAIVAGATYLVSPIDFIPGVIPIVGQLDDIAVALVTLRAALAGLDPVTRARHLDAVGLSDDDLRADLATLGVATTWLARRGLAVTGVVVRAGGRAAVTGGRIAARGGRAIASRGREMAGRGRDVAIRGRDAAATLRRRRSDSST
jgi:uncharacterized membrane protein YkvA (DUF1232 family)